MTQHATRSRSRRQPLLQDPVKLRRRRHEAGLLLTTVAKRAGISKGYLSQIETGKQGVRPPVLARIAAVLGCAPAEVMPDLPVKAAV